MNKPRRIRALLLPAYCIPFAFLAVNGDASSGTMLFYGVMAAGFALLCLAALKANLVSILYIGNLLSFASSCVFAKLSGLEPMGYYFTPFTSYSLIAAISIVSLVVHTLIVLARAAGKRRNGS